MWWRHFLNWGFSFQVTLACVMLTKNNQDNRWRTKPNKDEMTHRWPCSILNTANGDTATDLSTPFLKHNCYWVQQKQHHWEQQTTHWKTLLFSFNIGGTIYQVSFTMKTKAQASPVIEETEARNIICKSLSKDPNWLVKRNSMYISNSPKRGWGYKAERNGDKGNKNVHTWERVKVPLFLGWG